VSTRILVIPGLGDLHWVALKLRSFCEVHHIDDPEVWVWDFDDRPRSLEYVQRLLSCRSGGYWHQPLTNRTRSIFNECYMLGSRDVVTPFEGFDHFLCVNGSLRQGRTLSEILSDCAIEWDYPLRTTPEELRYSGEQLSRGKYLLLYFSDQGMFRTWLASWTTARIALFLDTLHETMPEYRLLLTGSRWDERFAKELLSQVSAPVENLVGQTSLDELMGLIRSASGFVGWCGGNTIISTHLGTPTYMFWSGYFCKGMQTNWVDPNKLGSTYRYDSVANTSAVEAAAKFAAQVEHASQ